MLTIGIVKTDTFRFPRHNTTRLSLTIASRNWNVASQAFDKKAGAFPVNGQNILAPLLRKRLVVVKKESEWFHIFIRHFRTSNPTLGE